MRLLSAACLVVALLASGMAVAQDDTDATARATALVDRGLDLRESGDDVAARTLMVEAYELAASPRTAAQLGLVEQALGLWADAERHLQEALAHGDDAWIRSHRRALDHSIAIIAENLGTLQVIANVPGATVSIRGSVVATLPAPSVRVPIGPTDIIVAAPGYQSETFSLNVTSGALSRQLVELEPVRAVEPLVVVPDERDPIDVLAPTITPPSPPRGPGFVWSFVGLAATAALAGAAIGTGVQTQSVYDDLSRTCGGPGCTSAQISSSGLEAWQTTTNALAIGAGAVGAATIVLFVVEGTTGGGSAQLSAGPGGLVIGGAF